MEKRAKSTHQFRQQFDLQELSKAKQQMMCSFLRRNNNQQPSLLQKTNKRSYSHAPSSLFSAPNYRSIISHSPHKIKPLLRLKISTFFSVKNISLQQQVPQKVALSHFNKYLQPTVSHLCRTCEEKNTRKPRLFKRKK